MREMPQLSEREALHRLLRLYRPFDDALAVLESHPAHLDVKPILHQYETLREMRDRLLPLEVGPAPKVTEKGFARLLEPELSEELLYGLQISRSKFPALCARLEEIDIPRLADTASLPESLSNALSRHGATIQQVKLVCYAFAASVALQGMLSALRPE
jgi:hypothetical protein